MSGYTYVYVIAGVKPDGRFYGPCKVGYSRNPYARARELQTGSAYPLAVLGCVAIESDRASRLETATHAYIGSLRRLSGEWFDIDPYQAISYLADVYSDVLVACVEDEGIPEFHRLEEELGVNGLRRKVSAERYLRAWEGGPDLH